MMTRNEVATATLDQLTDELAAAGWDSTQQTVEEAREAVLRLLDEMDAVTACQYRYEPGHLYALQRDAYVHCYSCNPSLSQEQAIEQYESDIDE